jgi:catechol 2,3-dioxygenase-like lactoylglutathione lyase family enzyme
LKIKSVSGITCYVKNLNKTARFYEALGFQIKKREPDHITAYSNWFWIDFVSMDKGARAEAIKSQDLTDKGAGLSIYLSVDNVDDFYQEIIAHGMKPSSEPQNQPWGNREFLLQDPDGYNLVIFRRK